MPEGPEIRLAADKVARVLVGDDIIEVGFGLARLSRFEKSLSGSTVTAVDTRGKAMLTRFDNGLTLWQASATTCDPRSSGPQGLIRI